MIIGPIFILVNHNKDSFIILTTIPKVFTPLCLNSARPLACLQSFPSHSITINTKLNFGGFHLLLLVFPFVYHFNSRIGVLVNSSFANN